jgi:hypothetical protein
MRVREGAALALVVLVTMLASGCQQSIFRQYEYEEEIYLKLDGSATVIVNASAPALVALRGLVLDPDQPIDRDKVRSLYDAPEAQVVRVSRPWRRNGRRFVQVRLDVPDIRRLGAARPFAWSSYALGAKGEQVEYRQTMGAPAIVSEAGAAGTDGVMKAAIAQARWDGTELIAIRMHLPSKIDYHNAPSKRVDRGNIVSWEQPLRDRLAGKPIDMEVRMENRSILNRTLTIFGLALVAALLVLAGLVFWVKQKGRAAA